MHLFAIPLAFLALISSISSEETRLYGSIQLPFLRPPAPVAPAPAPSVVPLGCVMFGIMCPPGYNSGGGGGGGGGGGCSATVPTNIVQFREAAVRSHNAYRAQHKVGPLVEDPALTASAQRYAEILACNNNFAHSPEARNGQYGENLAMIPGVPSGNVAVDMWYGEIKDYNFASTGFTPPPSPVTGHFTAVVWKGTTKIGNGAASNGRYTYVVSHYSPPGNIGGQFPANVLSK